MALVQCKECGNQVSTTATACPKCGAPPPAIVQPPAAPLSSNKNPVVLILGGIIAIIALGYFAKDSTPPPKPSDAPVMPHPAQTARPVSAGSFSPYSDRLKNAQETIGKLKARTKAGGPVAQEEFNGVRVLLGSIPKGEAEFDSARKERYCDGEAVD